jgi:hypothetical protein
MVPTELPSRSEGVHSQGGASGAQEMCAVPMAIGSGPRPRPMSPLHGRLPRLTIAEMMIGIGILACYLNLYVLICVGILVYVFVPIFMLVFYLGTRNEPPPPAPAASTRLGRLIGRLVLFNWVLLFLLASSAWGHSLYGYGLMALLASPVMLSGFWLYALVLEGMHARRARAIAEAPRTGPPTSGPGEVRA